MPKDFSGLFPPITTKSTRKVHGRYDWLAEDSHFYMAPDPIPNLLLSCFIFFIWTYYFEHFSLSPYLMNKFKLLLRPQNVILNEILYKEIFCWFRCWNLLIIRCIDDNCRFLSLTRCIGFTCILTSFRWIILAKYVKTHGLFTILLKSMLHCLQLIVMHNWTKEYLDWTKRS